MRKLSEIIVEDGIKDKNSYNWVRKASRGIVLKDDKVLMIYSPVFDDYTFPGGGVKKDESYQRALYRELREEVGAKNIKIVRAFGQTLEVRKSFHYKGEQYRQISKYFICRVEEFGEQQLDKREEDHGAIPLWIEPAKALAHNQSVQQDEMHQRRGAKTTIIRENIVLKMIIKEGIK
ncbi:MAG: NUDIX hydrolase [Acholeplasmataceae bacterium]|jgi:dUTP pyrophosphatase